MEDVVIEVKNLRKWFPVRMSFIRSLIFKERIFVKAVDGINFSIKRGEIFGLVGESGSGKTTTGRVIARLIEPTDGKVLFKGKDIWGLSDKELKKFRRKVQIIFQDPYESLNPRMTVYDIIAEPLKLLEVTESAEETNERVNEILESVDLVPPEEFVYRYPHELSGGQRQRVATARAFVANPEFVIADEPVSMLDVSIRAEILDLMIRLVEKYRTSYLYITHDLALARHMCDRIAVMYLGKIFEMGTTEQIIYEPLNPYTKALIDAVPVPDPTRRRREIVIKGEIPSPINPPSGCRFHTRCPSYIGDICRTKEPPLVDVGKGHYVACHLYSGESKE
ncbi:MAG: ABC transporter ATP-binding protein [Candidatus Baldrarchaeia archaeon]